MSDKPSERTVRAVPRFVKSKRRLTPAAQAEVDAQVKTLIHEPLRGEPKKGALNGVRVVKFSADGRQYLLAYSVHVKQNAIEVLDIGVHENFYRGLEGYLKNR